MISVIICSQNERPEKKLIDNIKATIGTDHEVIHIDNSKHKFTIFEAYNIGIKQAKGEYLCFMHEDVIYREAGWGEVVEKFLAQEHVGILGVAGGHVVANQLDWRFYGFAYMYLIQGTTSVEPSPIYYVSYQGSKQPLEHGLKQVAAIDGVWMCSRKKIFDSVSFDTQHFHDFHLYDTDICMQINLLGKGVYITDLVKLEHLSEGSFSEGYHKNLQIFFQKWRNELPLVRGASIPMSDIEDAVAAAQPYFEQRLHHDQVVQAIRQLIKQKKANYTYSRDFSNEEITIMSKSAFNVRKHYIKNYSIARDIVWNMVKDYLKMPFVHRKVTLLLKFFWYRVLTFRQGAT